METAIKLGRTILVYIVFFAVLIGILLAINIGLNKIFNKWVRYTHPDYDRVLACTERKYIEKSQADLTNFEKNFKPKPDYFIYQFIYIPMMFVAWALLYAFGLAWLTGLIYLLKGLSISEIYQEILELGDISSAIIMVMVSWIFGGILFAGWLCYAVSALLKDFPEWLTLRVGAENNGESNESILNRRLQQIVHDVRIGRLDPLGVFNPSEFLRTIYRRHQWYCMLITLIIVIPSLILGTIFIIPQIQML